MCSNSSLFPSSPFPSLPITFPAMLSTFPASLPADFPPFLFHPEDEPAVFTPLFSQEPVSSNSGSDERPKLLSPDSISGSGSEDQYRVKFKTIRSGSELDERKRRRMMSNRESARRSRMRKQKHVENLRNQLNRHKLGNREQTNRLRMIVYQTQLFRSENECLRTEAAALRQRLWDIRQVLAVRQLQQLLSPMPMQINHPNF